MSIKHIAQMYCVNGKYFAEQYRNRISGYTEWREAELGCGFYFNANNIGLSDARQTGVPAHAQEQMVGQKDQRDILI